MAKDLEVRTTFRAVDKTSRVVTGMQAKIQKFAAKASMHLRRIDRVMSGAAGKLTSGFKRGLFAAAAGATALGGAVGFVMKQFSKVEDAEAAFTPLLGGVGRAKELVDALNKTAATTPFQFETLAGAAKQLLPNMGGDIKKTIELTRMLGDTAGGNAQKMDSIVRGYNKALLKGKVDMESLNMIAEAGVPIFNTLGETIGKQGSEMFNAISAGKVTTEQLTTAFQKMTGKGGIFFKGMEIASGTLSGKISTLKDNVSLAAAEFGSALAPTMKDLTDTAIKYAQQLKEWVTQNKALIKTKVTKFIKKIPGYLGKIAYWVPKIAKAVGVFYAITAAVKIATFTMNVFNAATKINLGPAKKFGSYMGNQLPGQIGKGTGALNKMKGAVGVLGAAFAGWEIGTIIHDQIIEPMMKAHDVTNKMISGISATMGQVDRLPTYALEDKLKEIDKAKKAVDEDTFRQIYDPLGFTRAIEKQALGMAERRVRGAIETRRPYENIRRYSEEPTYTPIEVPEWERPQVSTTATEHRESVEVTIKDETGRATVSKGPSPGKGKGFKLKHSGAMP